MKSQRLTRAYIARLVRRCLREGHAIEIDGLGVFRPRPDGEVTFTAFTGPQVFIAYADEDLPYAMKLYANLQAAGLRPWLDKQRLLPGQNWPRAIEQAISVADFFVPCFSTRSIRKRGRFQAELRYALECAAHLPLDDSFILPVRLDDCAVPPAIAGSIQYVDLFHDWDAGVAVLRRAINRTLEFRQKCR